MADIRQFLEIRQAVPMGFSHDGSKVLIASNLSGTFQLYRTDLEGSDLVQLTDFEEPALGRYLPDVDRLLVTMDEGGNERNQIYLMDEGSQDLEKVVFDPDYIHDAGGISRDGSLLSYATNRRNGVDFDIVVHDLRTAQEKVVFAEGGFCSAGGFSPDGRYVSLERLTERTGDNDTFLVNLETGEVTNLVPHADQEDAEVGSPAWLEDAGAFFFSTDLGRDRVAVARYDVEAGEWGYVLERDWDSRCFIDEASRRLFVHTNDDGRSRLATYDPKTLESLGEVELPGDGVILTTRTSKDGRYLTLGFSGPTSPGDTWLYDLDEPKASRITESPNPLSSRSFAVPALRRFKSFDGEEVPYFFYPPSDGDPKAPPPVVFFIHGGPESQFRPAFNPVIAYLVDRGFAVAAPNVRGSTGYGKRYHHLDDVERRLDSVRDLPSMADHLTAEGLIDGERIALMGGSYGGYMVLAGLAFHPDRFAAGVDIVGISSLVTFLENTSAWRRAFREREYGSLANDREFLESASPLSRVDDIQAPLFIIHGTNDPRVPVTEAEQLHGALKERGIPTELLVYEDEGHGLAKLKNRLDAYPQVAEFLDRMLN